MNRPLFDIRAAQYTLGCIMHQPEILYNSEEYILTVDDYADKLYGLLFGAIYNMSYEGATAIGPTDIEFYLSSFPTQHEYVMSHQGLDLLQLIYETTANFDTAQFEIHYSRMKKFSTLRELRKNGIDISEFYNDALVASAAEEQAFNDLTVADILSRIRNKVQLVENKHSRKQGSSSQYAASGIRELLTELKNTPDTGMPLEGRFINYATRGCRKGKLFTYSAPSGGGKTRTMVGNACGIAFPKIVNGQLVHYGALEPVLFVATEMQADEIQTLILAWISGVNEEKIILGSYTDEESKLLEQGIYIMEKYLKNFVIETIPNPSIQSLKAMMTNYIIHDEIEHIFYDYIFTSVGLMEEFRSINLREDVALMMFANTLKEIAAVYKVFVMTGTQLNSDWENKSVRTMNTLRGSKAIADKIDIGMIGVRCSSSELESVQTYCEKRMLKMPNIVIDIYKNRRGRLSDMKIFRYFDYGTCRAEDIVVTNNNYQVMDDIPQFEYDMVTEEFKYD